MSTNFPGFFDSYTTKADNVDTVSASHINNLQDAIVALEGQFSVNGNVGLVEGRLSLSTTDPTDYNVATAATNVYYLPFIGNRIAVFNTVTTGWDVLSFGSASVSVPATTNTPFDIFAYNNSGTLTLQTVNWSSDTARATSLARQDGILCKTGDLGKRYLGTGRTTGVSGQTENSTTKRFLWNYYNQQLRVLYRGYSASHTYNTATWRPFNNNSTDTIFEWVFGGFRADHLRVDLNASVGRVAGNSILSINFGHNSTTTPNAVSFSYSIDTSSFSGWTMNNVLPINGRNYICPLEYSNAAGTAPTFYDTAIFGGFLC